MPAGGGSSDGFVGVGSKRGAPGYRSDVAGRRPEEVVRRAMLHQRWRNVAFIHWQCDPEMLRPLLPANLEVDTFDGAAWIGLTPLTIEQSRPPAVPGLSSFPETNLRTYVIGPDGRDGLWFFSLEADSLSTVIAARCLLGVPYRWAAMTVDRTPQRCTYVSRRRRRSTVIGHHIVVGLGSAVAADDVALTLSGTAPGVSIPSVMISQANGAVIKAGHPAAGVVKAAP